MGCVSNKGTVPILTISRLDIQYTNLHTRITLVLGLRYSFVANTEIGIDGKYPCAILKRSIIDNFRL